MHIVAIAWMFVVVLMTAAEATSSQGSLLGAIFTFVLYGVLPLGLLLYILGTPARKAARRRAEAAASATSSADAGNAGGHAAGDRRAPEREEA